MIARLKLTFLALTTLIWVNADAQSSLDLRCLFYPHFEIDTTYKEENKWRYIPTIKDSLLLYEEIIIVRYNNKITKRQFNKIMNKKLENCNTDIGIYYSEKLSDGYSYNNYFVDFLFFYSISNYTDMIYSRNLYDNMWKGKNFAYSINYTAKIPRYWWSYEKWALSEQHFLEKYKLVKVILNSCK